MSTYPEGSCTRAHQGDDVVEPGVRTRACRCAAISRATGLDHLVEVGVGEHKAAEVRVRLPEEPAEVVEDTGDLQLLDAVRGMVASPFRWAASGPLTRRTDGIGSGRCRVPAIGDAGTARTAEVRAGALTAWLLRPKRARGRAAFRARVHGPTRHREWSHAPRDGRARRRARPGRSSPPSAGAADPPRSRRHLHGSRRRR